METFNKYAFIKDLKEEIQNEIDNENLQSDDQIETFVHESIDNQCIYTHNCWQIAIELQLSDFNTMNGIAQNVCQLAYDGLTDFVFRYSDEYEYEESDLLLLDSYKLKTKD